MSFLSRMFHFSRNPVAEIKSPDDSALKRKMEVAKRENTQAVASFVKASNKQERDARFARYVIEEIITRADNIKDMKNAGTQK